MTDIIRHRGPDDEGFLLIDSDTKEVISLFGDDSIIKNPNIKNYSKHANTLLGHRRLSIIDLSENGHQPMSNNDGTIWIIYNGEIYNYIELRKELQDMNYSFRTNSDTEVLIAAYEKWGEECVHKFNGMWSFVIYDKRKNILFGSRDRFGIKPLYYFLNDSFFIFASEIKSIVNSGIVKKEINNKVVLNYLIHGYTDTFEESFFKGIYDLLPSYSFILNLENGVFKKWKYFNLEYNISWEKYNDKKHSEHANMVRELLFNAIRFRLRSDAPIGTCLSGGIDSSSVVCIINEILKNNFIIQVGSKQKIFTASYDNEKIDESKWAGLVANHTNALWIQTFPTSDELLGDLEDLIYFQDIPFGSTSIYAQYRVMRLAHENGIKVLLDGQGADELFAGYASYYNEYILNMVKKFKFLTLLKDKSNLHNSPLRHNSLLRLVKDNIKSIADETLPWKLRAIYRRNCKIENKYFTDSYWNDSKHVLNEIHKLSHTELNKKLFEDFTYNNLQHLLKYEDRNSMRFSIEARTPFADDIHLIEYVFNIPATYKIHNGWSKFLLRESMKNVIPEPIRVRTDKIGFETPEYNWLKKIKINDYITSDLDNYFNVKNLLKDWDLIINAQQRQGYTAVWRFINFIIWKYIYSL